MNAAAWIALAALLVSMVAVLQNRAQAKKVSKIEVSVDGRLSETIAAAETALLRVAALEALVESMTVDRGDTAPSTETSIAEARVSDT